MDRAALEDLERRLKEATGPDQQLDFDIWYYLNDSSGVLLCKDEVPAFTASIDEALALVERMLPGRLIELSCDPLHPPRWWVGVEGTSHRMPQHSGRHNHAPLAILLALVSALIIK